MKEKIYNKLVRDNIPNIIENNNEVPYYKILDDVVYKSELEKKLLEEYNEVLNTTTKEERLEEFADMLEIIRSLSELENSNLEEVIKTMEEKASKRGRFKDKIYLEKVVNKTDK